VRKRLSRLLIALALAGSIGLHWAILQWVAWAGMVISYSQEGPVSQAVAKTFDGQHPCSLCKQITESKRSEKKPECKFEAGKLKFRYGAAPLICPRLPELWQLTPPDDATDPLTQAPPSPPPRA
jgi:hypothetical protein